MDASRPPRTHIELEEPLECPPPVQSLPGDTADEDLQTDLLHLRRHVQRDRLARHELGQALGGGFWLRAGRIIPPTRTTLSGHAALPLWTVLRQVFRFYTVTVDGPFLTLELAVRPWCLFAMYDLP